MKKTYEINILNISLVIFLFFFFIIIFSSNVFAFGIAPAKSVYNFEPNLEKEIDFLIVSKGDTQKYLSLEVEGELSEYVTLDKKSLLMDYGDTSKNFKVNIKLPSSISEGQHIIYVKIIEQDSMSSATTSIQNALVGQIIINVPYDGVHVDAKFSAQRSEINKPVLFTISLFGRGKTPANCYGVIDIKGPTNEVVDTVITNKILVKETDATKVEATWKGTENSGIYLAEATVHCEDKMQILNTEFYIGNPSIDILSIFSDKFILGEISPIDAILKSNWNAKLDNVYLEFFVLDNSNNIIQKFKSPATSINAKDIAELRSYWETKGLISGNYLINLIAYIDDLGTQQKSYKAQVSERELKVMELTGKVVSQSTNDDEDEEKDESSFLSKQISVLTIIVFLLVIFNIIFFLSFRKKNKKNDDIIKMKKRK